MEITNLEKVTFGVDDLAESERFWTDFGLDREPDGGPDCVRFLAKDGSGVELRASDDTALPPAVEPGPTIREATFGVKSQSALDALAGELTRDRDVGKTSTARCTASTRSVSRSLFGFRGEHRSRHLRSHSIRPGVRTGSTRAASSSGRRRRWSLPTRSIWSTNRTASCRSTPIGLAS